MENRKYKQGQVREFMGDGTRTVRFMISDESLDRHNSVIRSSAWDLAAFKNNPIAGWGHDVYGNWRAPDPDNIIGTWNVWTEGKELVGDLTFEDAETNPKAEKLFKKVTSGTLNSVSVGFMPSEQHEGVEEDGEERGVVYYDKVELAEVSLVPIPSNKNARKKALENGDIPELIEELIGEALGDEYNEKLTLKGLFAILRGDETEKIEKEETGEEVDTEARDEHIKQAKWLESALRQKAEFLIKTNT